MVGNRRLQEKHEGYRTETTQQGLFLYVPKTFLLLYLIS